MARVAISSISRASPSQPGGPPWTLCPGDPPLTVGVSFHDNGKVAGVFDTVSILSNATGQPVTTMTVVPVTHPVPRENPQPIEDLDGGANGAIQVFDSALFVLDGLDANADNYEYVYYIEPDDAGVFLDGGANDEEVVATPQDPGLFEVCVELIEVDAGFGNCGFIFGGADAGQIGSHLYCSSPVRANP